MNRKRGQGREEGGRGKLFLRERERERGRERNGSLQSKIRHE